MTEKKPDASVIDASKYSAALPTSIVDVNKPISEATQEAQTEMSAEEQQEILKQIIKQAKQRSVLGMYKKPAKMVSPNAAKKRKAKSKMQKQSRKTNRK